MKNIGVFFAETYIANIYSSDWVDVQTEAAVQCEVFISR